MSPFALESWDNFQGPFLPSGDASRFHSAVDLLGCFQKSPCSRVSISSMLKRLQSRGTTCQGSVAFSCTGVTVVQLASLAPLTSTNVELNALHFIFALCWHDGALSSGLGQNFDSCFYFLRAFSWRRNWDESRDPGPLVNLRVLWPAKVITTIMC